MLSPVVLLSMKGLMNPGLLDDGPEVGMFLPLVGSKDTQPTVGK